MLKLTKIKPESWNDEMPMGKTHYPYLNLDSDEVPEVKDWEVGKTYQIVLEVKQTSKSQNKEKKDVVTGASFDIVAYGIPKNNLDDLSGPELEKMQAEGLSTKKTGK